MIKLLICINYSTGRFKGITQKHFYTQCFHWWVTVDTAGFFLSQTNKYYGINFKVMGFCYFRKIHTARKLKIFSIISTEWYSFP